MIGVCDIFRCRRLTNVFSVSLPSLDQAKGQTTINGGISMSCSSLNGLQSQGVFKGSYSCGAGSSGLSGGAKGGIAVGVILSVLLLLLLLWFVLRRRRQKRRLGGTEPTVSSPSTAEIEVEKVSLPEERVSPASEPPNLMPRKPVGSAIFLDGRSIHEAPIAATPVQECHELDGGPVLSSHQRPIHAEQDDPYDPVTKLSNLGDQENGHLTQP
jgi:hypothetical protein